MAKFVWIEVEGAQRVPVNPDQVRYLRRTVKGKTALVFGAFAGGFDEVVSEMSAEDVVALLEPSSYPAWSETDAALMRIEARLAAAAAA